MQLIRFLIRQKNGILNQILAQFRKAKITTKITELSTNVNKENKNFTEKSYSNLKKQVNQNLFLFAGSNKPLKKYHSAPK